IREWARKNGHTVSDRGRLSGRVVEAYEAAH
ncbi:MAG: Lsr2 family protein, partial [Actinobacteria bacterium]|nr:Lsr2 family protein [Actinomycetota bacterium]